MLLPISGSRAVWVLKEDMTVEQRVVDAKEANEGWVPVEGSLKAGEKVVVSGVSKLAPGMKVALVEPTGNEDLDKNFKPRIKE